METNSPDHNGSKIENIVPDLSPHVGMKFRDVDEAWKFWVKYGAAVGFSVRIRYKNKRKVDGKVTTCRYVCSNEGHRAEDKRDYLVKTPRPETRTDCEARMCLKIDGDGYVVHELDLEHNHLLQLSGTSHLLVSQRKISEVQAFEIDTANDSGIGPRAAHELASTSTTNNVCQVEKEVQAPNVVLSHARFKKKEVPTKGSRRKKKWFEVKRRTNKKVQSRTISKAVKSVIQEEGSAGVQAQVAADNDFWDSKNDLGEYRVISSFTQLLTSSSADLHAEELLLQ